MDFYVSIYIYSAVISENFPQYKLDDSNLHEAAYDAYITGICFTAMSNFLGSYGVLLIFFFSSKFYFENCNPFSMFDDRLLNFFSCLNTIVGGLQNPPLPNVLPDAAIIKPFTNK